MSLGCFPLTLVYHYFFSCSLFIVFFFFFWNNSSLSKDVTFVTTLQYTSSSCKYSVQIKEGMFVPQVGKSPNVTTAPEKVSCKAKSVRMPHECLFLLGLLIQQQGRSQHCVWNTVQPERGRDRVSPLSAQYFFPFLFLLGFQRNCARFVNTSFLASYLM